MRFCMAGRPPGDEPRAVLPAAQISVEVGAELDRDEQKDHTCPEVNECGGAQNRTGDLGTMSRAPHRNQMHSSLLQPRTARVCRGDDRTRVGPTDTGFPHSTRTRPALSLAFRCGPRDASRCRMLSHVVTY